MACPPKYHLIYPEKNTSWYSDVPNKRMFNESREKCQIMRFTPTTCSGCRSTFNPAYRPTPNQCFELCKKPIPVTISGCDAERSLYPKNVNVNNNGCLMEPSIAEYTNMPLTFNRTRSILTNPMRNPPNVPQVDDKYSDFYDPILDTYGRPYTY